MSEQNRYKISYTYDGENWQENPNVWQGDTWQDAYYKWSESDQWTWINLHGMKPQVMSLTPSSDGRSGIIEVKENVPPKSENDFILWHIKVTIID